MTALAGALAAPTSARHPAPPTGGALAHPIRLLWAKERGYILAHYGGEVAEIAFKDAPPEWRDELTSRSKERRR